MRELILDAGPLITACQFTVAGQVIIDHMLENCKITIANSVRDEVVFAGRRYPDAQVAQQRISQAKIVVVDPPADPLLEAVVRIYNLGQGEQDSILLTRHNDLQEATLVLDDHLAYIVSDRLAAKKRFLLDVIVDLAKAGEMDLPLARGIIEGIRTRYPKSFVEHSLLLLER